MSYPLNIYRQEIIEAAKVRATFMQWKLVVVGAIAGFALSGMHVQDPQTRTIILMIIPLVCLYVDICCYQTTLRILVIADFLANVMSKGALSEAPDAAIHVAYEQHCREQWNHQFFILDDFALVWSSVAADAILILYPLLHYKELQYSLIVFISIPLFGGLGSLAAHSFFMNKAHQLGWRTRSIRWFN